ncbi:MAG: nucleotide exchange factor GrpE [Gemmatimonadota bacterium]
MTPPLGNPIFSGMPPQETPRDIPIELPEEDDGSRVEAGQIDPAAVAALGMDDGQTELQAAQDRLLRLQAEFSNFRKREARERAAAWARAKADLTGKLLGALDDLRRVAQLEPEGTSTAAVVDGVRLVERKLLEALAREGLAAVGEPGEPFDPHLHEAIGMLPAPSPAEAGRVAAVAARGYQFGSQLLRPAHVQVYEHRADPSA